LYDSFVSARDREERGMGDREGKGDKPRQGNTVYVFGYSITEDLIRSAFSSVGKIVNVSMEVEKVRFL
jgi:negative elongation factor E